MLQLTSVNGSLEPRYFTYPASRDVYRKLNVTASSTTTKTVSTLTTTTTSSTKSTTVLDAWHFDVLDFVYRWLLLIWTWKDSFYLACSLVSVPVVRFATVFFRCLKKRWLKACNLLIPKECFGPETFPWHWYFCGRNAQQWFFFPRWFTLRQALVLICFDHEKSWKIKVSIPSLYPSLFPLMERMFSLGV